MPTRPLFPPQISLHLGIMVAALLLASLLTAQVNTESLRREEHPPGWHSDLAASAGVIAGNSNLINLKGNLRFDYLAPGGHVFLVTQYQYGIQDTDFINKGFTHLRVVKALRPRLYVEGFLQKEFNKFINLQDRQLAGGGVRIKWRQPKNPAIGGAAAPPLQLNTGIGFMWEREQIGGAGDPVHGALASLLRSTNYLVVRWKIDDRLSLLSTTYFQFDVRRFSDFRILWEGNLSLTLTKKVSLSVNLNLRYDSEPPEEVKPYDIELTNGLSYSF